MTQSIVERRILLEGLNLKTSTNDIERFFTKWGPLAECIVLFDKNTRRSRGYGFISFNWDHHCDQCFEAQPHFIDGVQIRMRLIKDISLNPIVKYVTTRKILVSFLGTQLSVSEIEDYFLKFGSAHVDYAVDTRNEKPLYFAYVTFDEKEACESCMSIREHFIEGRRIFVRKVIRREDLKKAEQMDRIRAANEARIKEELEEEAERKRRQRIRKLRESRAAESILLNPPPPPSEPHPDSEKAPEPASSSSIWVPLLPSEETQEQSASYLAGYGHKKQHAEQYHHYSESQHPQNSASAGSSTWIPLPHGSIPEPSDVVRRYSTFNKSYRNCS